jgi:hypothetical protein
MKLSWIVATPLSLLAVNFFATTCLAQNVTKAQDTPTCTITSKEERYIILELILAEDYKAIDSALPESIRQLKKRGAHRCWHKHSTFLQHLLSVHNILRLWGQSEISGRVGLFHSAYSNSYVNLALLNPQEPEDRAQLQTWIGAEAADIVYLFCIINRQAIVVETLLKEGTIPPEGIAVPHLRNPDETIRISAESLRDLAIFTMADIGDQYFGWQDELYGGGGNEGSMITPHQDIPALHQANAIWPGISKPGLWMSYLSQLCQVAKTYETAKSNPIPPVFDNCTHVLTVDNDTAARDLYWSVISKEVTGLEEIVETLKKCHDTNPWAFEPLVILAQKLLETSDFKGALQASTLALELQLEWGIQWDKRTSFGAWVAWTRVLNQRATDQQAWPTNSWEVNNLGLVK